MTADLDSIRERLAAITPGPWFQGRDSRQFENAKEVYSEREPSSTSEDICTAWHPHDAAFIAAAPSTVERLLGIVEAVLELHQEDVFRGHLSNGCKTCGGGVGWPCPTIAAITGGGA